MNTVTTATHGRTDRTPQVRPASTPAVAAVAAWGAGLVHVALGAGAVTGGSATRTAGVALIALGAAGIAWGTVVLARGRIVVPQAGIGGAIAALLTGFGSLALDPARTSVLAVAAGSLLWLCVALCCAVVTRRRSVTGGMDAGPPRLWAIAGAAVVVAALVTPALGATEAGRLAPDHGEHGVLVDPHRH